MPKIDRTDARLLEALQDDARLTVAELAAQVALSPSPCWRRIKRMEEAGVIRGYRAELDAGALGLGVTAFVDLTLESHQMKLGLEFEEAVAAIPEILACHNVSGRYDYQLVVAARDLTAFGEFARDVIRRLPGVKEMHSSFSLKAVKARPRLPAATLLRLGG